MTERRHPGIHPYGDKCVYPWGTYLAITGEASASPSASMGEVLVCGIAAFEGVLYIACLRRKDR